MTLAISVDGGSSWTTVAAYTHPSSAGHYNFKFPIGMLAKTGGRIRWRLSGTGSANWGVRRWVVKYSPVPQEWDNA
jgi:hypothetical protein